MTTTSNTGNDATAETTEFTWTSGHHTIRINVTFQCKWSMDHLSITSIEPAKARLPITETGYLSRFLTEGAVEEWGGVEATTRMLLDEAAESPEWKKYLLDSRQLSLF